MISLFLNIAWTVILPIFLIVGRLTVGARAHGVLTASA